MAQKTTPGYLPALILSVLLVVMIVQPPGLQIHDDASAQIQIFNVREDIIQPGARLFASNSGNTLAWIFKSLEETNEDGEPILYATTTAHGPTPDEGETVRLSSRNMIEVGEVVAKEDGRGDWALIQIAEESREYVDFSIKHWSGPTGMPDPEDIRRNDLVCHYGHGTGFNLNEETRPRCGELHSTWYSEDEDGNQIGFLRSFPMTAFGGDSGSPIFHYETGQALGILRSLSLTNGAITSTDICTLIEGFANHGFHVELATAPYDPPPAKPSPPNPWPPILSVLRTDCLGS